MCCGLGLVTFHGREPDVAGHFYALNTIPDCGFDAFAMMLSSHGSEIEGADHVYALNTSPNSDVDDGIIAPHCGIVCTEDDPDDESYIECSGHVSGSARHRTHSPTHTTKKLRLDMS